MRYKLALTLGAALLAAAGLGALDQPKAKGGCCAPEKSAKAGGQAAAQEPLRCTLTGKTIESCCCAEKDGKLYCPLAKKTIESCCCVPANAPQAKNEVGEEPLRCGHDQTGGGDCCARRKQEKTKEN
ncbi:MAG: hypothetical protein L0212_05235 [Acidobacteria bacterium]|nr:hypothetical protein [Acidobacteriota bacterium]